MENKDTVFLLRECSAGVKTAVASIDGVLPFVEEETMKQILKNSKDSHKSLEKDIDSELKKLGSKAKEPNIMSKSMATLKINTELTFQPTETRAANIITDGCGMGIKSINKYLNQYPAAAENVKQMAQQLGNLEEDLVNRMKPYL